MNPDQIPEAWQPEQPADGFNPGPELTVSHDDITLTIQRSHLLDDHAIYHWQILTDGTLVPLVDGVLVSYEPAMPLHRVAGHLAWHWYHRDHPALKVTRFDWPAIRIYPATTRTPDEAQRHALWIIHQEALT